MLSQFFFRILILGILIVLSNNCNSGAIDKNIPLYTSHNIWYEKPNNIKAINYKKGKMLPAGTQVDMLGFGVRKRMPYFDFKPKNIDVVFRMYCDRKFQLGLSIQQLFNQTITSDNFNTLTNGLTSEEIEAIKNGKVKKGMSKEATLISIGYPPRHRTNTTSSNIWVYWQDWHTTFTVKFKDNIVIEDVNF